MNDEFYIKRTLKLASKAQGLTSPNPVVGAVIVRNGKIISEAFHIKPGTAHAEALAIEKAGNRAKGSTLYVNLEPCCHTEKRTPPCTKSIINAGIKKVVIAMSDPNAKVSGKGIMELRDAGISVKSGVLEDEAKRLNEFYTKYITSRKPFVILKIAMTLDGKIATPEGESKWITGEKARKIVHRLRSKVDAILTAIGTVKADDPLLTSRIKGGKDPKRIVIDPELDIPLEAKILRTPPETIIVTKNVNSKADYLEKAGIRLIHFKEKLDLNWLLEKLGEMEITSVLIEGGSSINSHALEDGIVDKVMFFIAPVIIGGRESFPAVGGKTYKRLNEAHRIKDISIKRIGKDILIEGYLRQSEKSNGNDADIVRNFI
ncbi:MAG: bifunctional diaminohydroxyphosphoribosylaminopyrimidine deaminase/5-amino-6-(5-phosphoribosylamino)uracil reductase RibD [Nitrospirae bacterium]|jgi:diaminohydroxyphosphoribosylaminopyrimidine deaminase / 5-amino-6-(5-phosphoribosylamino)uracil reductase|nr:bifunctional diaminohydroxyphosphoribosylaminopyrimidine deaminase/5-amino-6-(5-phosphoribosylamino)uracil reductase RibD [Nitrospirota bacterium]